MRHLCKLHYVNINSFRSKKISLQRLLGDENMIPLCNSPGEYVILGRVLGTFFCFGSVHGFLGRYIKYWPGLC